MAALLTPAALAFVAYVWYSGEASRSQDRKKRNANTFQGTITDPVHGLIRREPKDARRMQHLDMNHIGIPLENRARARQAFYDPLRPTNRQLRTIALNTHGAVVNRPRGHRYQLSDVSRSDVARGQRYVYDGKFPKYGEAHKVELAWHTPLYRQAGDNNKLNDFY